MCASIDAAGFLHTASVAHGSRVQHERRPRIACVSLPLMCACAPICMSLCACCHILPCLSVCSLCPAHRCAAAPCPRGLPATPPFPSRSPLVLATCSCAGSVASLASSRFCSRSSSPLLPEPSARTRRAAQFVPKPLWCEECIECRVAIQQAHNEGVVLRSGREPLYLLRNVPLISQQYICNGALYLRYT